MIRLLRTFSCELTCRGSAPCKLVFLWPCHLSGLHALCVTVGAFWTLSKPATCPPCVCCRYCLLGCCLSFAFLKCFSLCLQIFNEKKYLSIFMASGFWFMHRKAPCSNTIKTHMFFLLLCGFILHQTAPFLKIILEQSKRPRLEVGHQGVVFQHPGVNAGVPLQQLMPTVQGKTQHQNQLL